MSAVLVRHGETEWTISGRHTGSTDLSLTENGRAAAAAVAPRLAGRRFAAVFCSPLKRARETCELAGFGDRAQIREDLREWNYGDYEGLTSPEIHRDRPAWSVFRDGCPRGESPAEMVVRVSGLIADIRAIDGHVLLFAHGHVLRSLGVTWIGLPIANGDNFVLDPGAVSELGDEPGRAVVRSWNTV